MATQVEDPFWRNGVTHAKNLSTSSQRSGGVVDRTVEFRVTSGSSAFQIVNIPEPNNQANHMENSDNNNGHNRSDAERGLEQMEDFARHVDEVRDALTRLGSTIALVENLHRQTLLATDLAEAKRLGAAIDGAVSEFQTGSQQAKHLLRQLADSTATATPAGKRQDRIRASTVSKLSRDLVDKLAAFREMQTTYQAKYHGQLERQYLIIRPQASRAELDRLADVANPLVLSQQVSLTFNHSILS
jgi:t-SNARE complex subunit (syntaxin)